jgi:hypothetical protein
MNRFERFCDRHSRAGIKNLMLAVAIGNLIVYFLGLTDRGSTIVSYFYFSRGLILQGQVWRLVSYVFLPNQPNIIFLALSLFFYYWIGKRLENEWGILKFNIFYFSGLLLTSIFCLIIDAGASAIYLNLSLFFAYATIFADNVILLFMIIPIKVKYLAFVEAAYYFLIVITGSFPYNMLPLVALLNYFFYFGSYFIYYFKNKRKYTKRSIDFKKKVRDIKKDRGYLHRCTVCGKTDTEFPGMEFRYCSLCKDYACYCEEHIMDHTHIQ